MKDNPMLGKALKEMIEDLKWKEIFDEPQYLTWEFSHLSKTKPKMEELQSVLKIHLKKIKMLPGLLPGMPGLPGMMPGMMPGLPGMKVDELIEGWTPTEKEQLKDLIDECKKREVNIKDNAYRSQQLLKTISDHRLGTLAETLYYLIHRTTSKDGEA